MKDEATKTVRLRLAELHDQRGELLLEDIVEDARPDESPLHSHFEWDDAKASDQYRLYQAGCLVRSVLIRYERQTDTGPLSVSIRQYQSTHEGRAAYHLIDDMLADPEQERALLARFQEDAARFQRRYGMLAEYRRWIRQQATNT